MATTKLEPVLRPDGRWQCGFVTTCNRAVLQLNRNGADGGAAFLEASADGETFAPLTPPILAPDITVPVNLPKGFTVRVTSSSPITYACVIADIAAEIPVDPTQMYYRNAVRDYDGNWYDAVIIGNQVWTAENLRTTHYSDGTPITSQGVGGPNSQSSDTIPYYYTLSGDQNFGRLYNQAAVLNGESPSEASPSGVQGISPNGWHVPSKLEFEQLIDYVKSREEYIFNNDSNIYAKSLASEAGWSYSNVEFSIGKSKELNNRTKFSFYPAGGVQDHAWATPYGSGSLWSSTALYQFYATYDSVNFWISSSYRRYGCSVRCVCDMAPDAFRSWYVRTYNTNNHQVDNKYATD